MNLEPLLDASLAIRLHVATVVPAAILGGWLLYARKGTPIHRLLGRAWLLLMVATSLSTFFIHEINMVAGFSVIHLLSVNIIVLAWLAIQAARQHRIDKHRRYVMGMYAGGILAAGFFTLMPGRIMNRIFFTVSPTGLGQPSAILSFLALMAGSILVFMAMARMMSVRGT